MKTWYLLPFVMVLGVLVGRYLPQEDLRTVKTPPKPVEQPARNDSFNSLTRMMQIPDKASRPPRRAPVPEEAVAAPEGGGEAVAAAEKAEESPPGF